MAKVDILQYLMTVMYAPAQEIRDAIGITTPAAGMALLRMYRNGLLIRAFDPRQNVYVYAISEKGRSRLRFFFGGMR